MIPSPRLACRRADLVRRWAAAVVLLSLAGCAASTARPDYDPWEPMNRGIFWFNEQADQYILEPVAKGWDWLMPQRVKTSVSNFFYNLRFPINTVNNVLQLDPRETAVHVARFMVNTTFGIGGLFDPATDWGLVATEEDFGQTLGRWGVPPGPYIVIPVFGPSTLRDLTRYPVDGFISGIGYTGFGTIFTFAYAVDTVNNRAANIDNIARAREASLDFYAAVRNLYLQRRQALINDSNVIPTEQTEDLYNEQQYETIP